MAACSGIKRASERTLRSNQPRREFVGVALEAGGNGVEIMVGVVVVPPVVVVPGQELVVVQSVSGG